VASARMSLVAALATLLVSGLAAAYIYPLSSNVAIIAASAGFHAIIFFLVPAKGDEGSNTTDGSKGMSASYIKTCIVSNVHAIVTIVYVSVWIYKFKLDVSNLDRTIGGGVDGTGDEYQSAIMAYSIGYFTYDFFVVCLDATVFTWGALIHHVLIGLSFGMGLFGGIARPLHFFYLLEELSTPFLNIKTLYRHHPTVHQAASLLFAVMFLASRMVYGMWIYYHIMLNVMPFTVSTYYLNPFFRFQFFFQIITCTGTRILNAYWTYLIVGKLIEAVTGKPRKSKKPRHAAATGTAADKLE